ncbi:outer membrane protein transport protein [Desulfobulbus sp. TB]|nr:outer membrane protein transport protein [Desulfobulbus sp. TB]
MTGYKASIFFMACTTVTAVFAPQHIAFGNPNQINSGYWALHIPFDLEPLEAVDGRSLGMGNATVAVMDDSAAALINPAGLATMQRVEITANLRHSSSTTDYLDTYANLTNIALGADSVEEQSTFDNDITDFSFIGLTLPIIPGQIVTSVYYKNSSFEGVDAQDSGFVPFIDPSIQQQGISRKNIDTYTKAAYGLAGAFNLGDIFSVGASVNLEQLDTGLHEQWIMNTFNNDQLDTTDEYDNRIKGDDTDVTFAVGAQYKPMKELSIGASYRKGANFTIPYTSANITCNALGVCNNEQEDDNVTFDIPDIWGIGIAWKALNGWLFSAQMDMVEYSVLQDATTEGNTMDEAIDDGIIFRLGVEKSFDISNSSQYQLRAGIFSVPDHDGFQAIDSDTVYYTLGAGVSMNEQFKVNVGTSFSEDLVDAVLSLSYAF